MESRSEPLNGARWTEGPLPLPEALEGALERLSEALQRAVPPALGPWSGGTLHWEDDNTTTQEVIGAAQEAMDQIDRAWWTK